MKYLVYALLFVVCLFLAAATFLLIAAPVDLIRDKMIAAVKEQTGRDLIVKGKTSLKFYPSVGLKITEVSLTPPPGMAGDAFVTMDGMEIDIPIMPLLAREIAVDRFILRRPVFEFRTDRNGRQSWDFASDGKGAAATAPAKRSGANGTAGGAASSSDGQSNAETNPQAAAEATDGMAADPTAGLRGFRLGDVRIVDGLVRYIDERASTEETISNINLTLNLEAIDKPFSAEGRVTWKGQNLPFRARLATPESLMAKAPTTIEFALDAAQIKASLKGKLETDGRFRLTAATQAEIPSLRRLAAWLGTKLPPSDGFGPVSFSGNIDLQPGAVRLNGADLKIDGAHAQGDLLLQTDRARPFIRAKLALDHLNVNTYTTATGKGGAAASQGKTGGKAKGKTGSANGDPIAGLIEDDQNEKPAAQAGRTDNAKAGPASGWSRKPIDLSGLKTVDADISFTLDKLTYQEIKIGRSSLTVALEDGNMQARFPELNLYGGRGTGTLALDASQSVAQVNSSFSISQISALPLMKDAVAFDWIDGKGDLSFNLAGAGRSPFQIVSSLAGDGNFVFANGAIVGVNIPGMVRGLTRGEFSGWSRSPSEKTDFSSLSGSFTMAKGVANNQDLQLVGPLIRVNGAGTINLPRQQLNYGVRPKIVASVEGQGGNANAAGLEIPFKIQGPWASPNFVPDLAGMLSNPQGAIDAINQIAGGKVDAKSIQDKLKGAGKGSKFESLIENALGGSSGNKKSQQKDLGGALKNLLGQ